jgi:catechol 2,3-dioxygenase-like lactoylglutathione lyase family enzyme
MRLLFALLLCATGTLSAQSSPAPRAAAAPITATGALIALSVADLQASSRWYEETFSLRSVMHVPVAEGRNGLTVLEGNGLIVELQQHAGAAAPDRAPAARQGIFKVGIVVADYDAALAAIRAKNIPIVIGPFPARDNQPPNFIIRDNSGNYLQILGALAR